ncbi:unnamed protein product [Closterium sp. Naga37s-1]|nr:unnamed protein product [Closterium sp. Naga37s-1]
MSHCPSLHAFARGFCRTPCETRFIDKPVKLYWSQRAAPSQRDRGAAGLLITEQQARPAEDRGARRESVSRMAQNEATKKSADTRAGEEATRGEGEGAEWECGVEEEQRAGEGWSVTGVARFGRVEVEGAGAERALANQRTCFSVTGGPGRRTGRQGRGRAARGGEGLRGAVPS